MYHNELLDKSKDESNVRENYFSYERTSHTKIHPNINYDISFAIPRANKGVVWFTSDEKNRFTCNFLENDKPIVNTIKILLPIHLLEKYQDTIFYGSVLLWNLETSSNEIEVVNLFVIEDIVMYDASTVFSQKLQYISDFLECIGMYAKFPSVFSFPKESSSELYIDYNRSFIFSLVVFWQHLFEKMPVTIAYPIHHIQYRSFDHRLPYLNISECKILIQKKEEVVHEKRKVFEVVSDRQYDIYHLYSLTNDKYVYFDVAFIPSYKISLWMNMLFHPQKESWSMDDIEESDDEFEYSIERRMMECVYNKKFNKWVPDKFLPTFSEN